MTCGDSGSVSEHYYKPTIKELKELTKEEELLEAVNELIRVCKKYGILPKDNPKEEVEGVDFTWEHDFFGTMFKRKLEQKN
jgi:hypothetical protein